MLSPVLLFHVKGWTVLFRRQVFPGIRERRFAACLRKGGEGTSHVPLLVANTLKVYRPNVWVILYLNKGHR